MIAFIANRPALQIGRHQVFDYDTSCLEEALRRAARAADQEDFPFVNDIHSGIVKYLETKCTLRLLTLNDLYERMRKMLMKIGCMKIAGELKPLAPPLTLSLVESANEAGNGFELAFFEMLRAEISELREAGAEKILFTGLRESSLILQGSTKWNKHCERMLSEMDAFLRKCGCDLLEDDDQAARGAQNQSVLP
ncbi:MAG: hypothetical protein NTU84_06205 [Verrucomicrobia bacterium]|nr:hypothetical protein [Verrucomicrobiota bacterium]